MRQYGFLKAEKGEKMLKTKVTSGIFGILGAAVLVLTAVIALSALNASPVMVEAPAEAGQTARDLMEAVCTGDDAAMEQLLYGNPDLGIAQEPADAVGVMLWQAYVESLQYQMDGDCYATDTGLSQNVTVTALDIHAVTEGLGETAEALLEQRVENSRDIDAIYDENNEYRQEFVLEVLEDAAGQVLQKDAAYKEYSLTLELVFRDGRWWVVADQALLNILSGGVAG